MDRDTDGTHTSLGDSAPETPLTELKKVRVRQSPQQEADWKVGGGQQAMPTWIGRTRSQTVAHLPLLAKAPIQEFCLQDTTTLHSW